MIQKQCKCNINSVAMVQAVLYNSQYYTWKLVLFKFHKPVILVFFPSHKYMYLCTKNTYKQNFSVPFSGWNRYTSPAFGLTVGTSVDNVFSLGFNRKSKTVEASCGWHTKHGIAAIQYHCLFAISNS